MFCPKCGKADQPEHTYCRGCGTYIYPNKAWFFQTTDSPPDTASWLVVFNILSACYCFLVLEKPTFRYGLFVAIFLQLFSAFVAYRLRRRLKRKPLAREGEAKAALAEAEAAALPAVPTPVVEVSVVENTTRKLQPVVERGATR